MTSVAIMIMSGVDDGTTLDMRSDQHGKNDDDGWTLSIGRKTENDLCLQNDTFVSRSHANLILQNNTWMLEDCKSTNGTFIENEDDAFVDQKVTGTIEIHPGQLFRVGRTWLRIQAID